MVSFKTPQYFSSPQGKKILGIAAVSAAAFTYLGLCMGPKKNVGEKEGNFFMPKENQPRTDYKSTDALGAVAHPAKNSNVKGSQPTASKWL